MAVLDRSSGFRLSVSNKNVTNMLGSITSILAEQEINVIDLLNRSRGDLAYNLIDVESEPSQVVLDQLQTIAVSYTHLRAHETSLHLVCRLLL